MKNTWILVGGFLLALICVVLAVVFVCTSIVGENLISRAKMDIKSIEKAVQMYKVEHNALPESLQVLTQPIKNDGKALFTEADLKDPWGQPYHYEPDNCHPKTKTPLIWSDGPPEAPRKIANWESD
jgi:hypothetical protein